MEHLTDDEILSIASAVGINHENIRDELLQFATDMQAHALTRFAEWMRENDDGNSKLSFSDVAINAELCAAELCAWTI